MPDPFVFGPLPIDNTEPLVFCACWRERSNIAGDVELSLAGEINMVGRGLDYLVQSEIKFMELSAIGYELRNRDEIQWEYIRSRFVFLPSK